jgi:DNA-binding transcriptional LysR family regulator
MLGVVLFSRTSRRVTLTDAGRLIVEESRRALAQVDSTLEVALRVSKGEIRHIAIGFLPSATAGILPDAIYALRTAHPHLRVTLEERPDSEQIHSLLQGRLDVGFLRSYDAMGNELRMEVVESEPFVAVLPESHPLADREEVVLTDLAAEPFILWPREMAPTPYDAFMSACWHHGFNPHVRDEALNAHTTLALVGAGLGITILAQSYQQLNYWQGLAFVPIRGLNTELLVVWRGANKNPMLTEFLRIARTLRANRRHAEPALVGQSTDRG